MYGFVEEEPQSFVQCLESTKLWQIQTVWRSELLAGMRDRVRDQEDPLLNQVAFIDDLACVMTMTDF